MNKKLIDGVREYYNLNVKVSDAEIEEELTGSLGEALVTLRMRVDDFKIAIGNVFRSPKKGKSK